MSEVNRQSSNVWAIRHRPSKLEEVILPAEAMTTLAGMAKSGEFMSITLSGSAGIGKTTAAKAICNDLNAEVLFLHGSGKDRGIDAMKGRVVEFATMMSLDGKPKFIIVDEADNLTNDAQMALRSIIEDVATNCTFILTCNYPGRILDAILSRCYHIRMEPTSVDEIKAMKGSMAKRMVSILKEENVKFTKTAIMSIVNSCFPDFRQTLNLTQKFALGAGVNDTVAQKVQQSSSSEYFKLLAQKDLQKITKWVMANVIEPSQFAASLWPTMEKHVDKETLPYAIVFLNELQTDLPIVADKHLSIIAFSAKAAIQCKFVDAK